MTALPFSPCPTVLGGTVADLSQQICDVKTWQVVWPKLLTPSPLTVKILAAEEFVGVLPHNKVRDALQQFASKAGATIRKLLTLAQDCWYEITAPSNRWCATGQLQEFLLTGESVGLLHVQDIVSALPCLVADSSAEVVLDLCAAQGTHGWEHLQQHCGDKARILIANEVDTSSATPLKDRIQYQPCAARGVLVTTVDPASFPVLRSSELHLPEALHADTVVHGAPGLRVDELSATCGRYCSHQATLAAANPWWQERRTQFDLIFANVPCGGDGMARTKPETLARWSTARGLALFPKQLAILRRGLQLLRPGGHLIYSTRSLDPVQNEAVVAAAMCIHNGHEANTVCLQDVAARLVPEVADALLPGLQSWSVPGSDFSSTCPRLFRTWSEVPRDQSTTEGPRPHREMFPGFSSGLAEDCVKCRRAVPCAALDSGCLFLALIHKPDTQGLKKKTVFAPRCHPIFKPAKSVNGLDPERGCILKFFGLHSEEVSAAACGVSRFPLELVALAPASRDILVLRSPAGAPLQEHKELKTVGGGLPLLRRVARGGRFFQHEPPGQVFVWRPLPEAVGIFGRCCTRRLVSLPPALLAALLTDLELGFSAIPPGSLVGCNVWGDHVRGAVVPGGVVVGLAGATGRCGPPFFAALLSSERLLLLGGPDARHRLHARVLSLAPGCSAGQILCGGEDGTLQV